MKKTYLRRSAAGLAAGLLLFLSACGQAPTPSEPASSAPTTTTAAPTTTAPPMGLNPLTGRRDMKTDNDRPIGFVVTDETSNLAQLNIESADMYFEAETEGGIPRILAIYSSIDRIPERVGPVRSARPHFVKFAKALDCIYCHIGGSQTGLDTIKQLKLDDVTNASVIDPTLAASQNYSWNRSAFTRDKVNSVVSRRGFSTTTATRSPFQFGEKAGTTPANTLVVKISESYDMAFTYDAATGVYQKHRNALSTPVHTTTTGGTITASNVIVMYATRTVDEVYTYKNGSQSTRYDFDLTTGSGILVTGGTSRNIRWQCQSDRLSYYESDGTTPLTVAEGKTFICLASSSLKGRTTVQ